LLCDECRLTAQEERGMTRTIAEWKALQATAQEPEPERAPIKRAMGDSEDEAADDEEDEDDDFEDEDEDDEDEESEEEENADDAGGISPYWV
jgi:hypothetical protein